MRLENRAVQVTNFCQFAQRFDDVSISMSKTNICGISSIGVDQLTKIVVIMRRVEKGRAYMVDERKNEKAIMTLTHVTCKMPI